MKSKNVLALQTKLVLRHQPRGEMLQSLFKGNQPPTLAERGGKKNSCKFKNCWIPSTNGTSVPNAWSLYLFQSLFKGFALQYVRVWLQSLLKGFTAVLVERAGGT